MTARSTAQSKYFPDGNDCSSCSVGSNQPLAKDCIAPEQPGSNFMTAGSLLRSPPVRYLGLAFLLLFTTHYLFQLSSTSYASSTSLSHLSSHVNSIWSLGNSRQLGHEGLGGEASASSREDYLVEEGGNGTRRANAAFVILARNTDVWEILESIRGMEGELVLRYMLICRHLLLLFSRVDYMPELID